MTIHFIAIGGSIMHNLAIALSNKGHTITGSDDQIYDPARSKLKQHGLLPEKLGWSPEKITSSTDLIILGMHAQKDNPELKKAQSLNIRIQSFPEFIYEESKKKKRVVIAGSHGKTTITAIILHVLQYWEQDFDFLVGAELEGFDTMVRLTKAPVIVMEGDEYLASVLQPRPKFLFYHPHIALISGIAWDHINVFPTYEEYLNPFKRFLGTIEENGTLIYHENDETLRSILGHLPAAIKQVGYQAHPAVQHDHQTYLTTDDSQIPIHLFGQHNLMNINGARLVCRKLGLTDEQFYEAIPSFKGAQKRLERIDANETTAIYRDFAHAPSKLAPTLEALKNKYPGRQLVACVELHTYSSLDKQFITYYRNTMKEADFPFVYMSPHTFEQKRLPLMSREEVRQAFDDPRLEVYFDQTALIDRLKNLKWENKNLVMMSSGNFNNLDFEKLQQFVINS